MKDLSEYFRPPTHGVTYRDQPIYLIVGIEDLEEELAALQDRKPGGFGSTSMRYVSPQPVSEHIVLEVIHKTPFIPHTNRPPVSHDCSDDTCRLHQAVRRGWTLEWTDERLSVVPPPLPTIHTWSGETIWLFEPY